MAILVAFQLCRDCDWQPDRKRRKSADAQAQEHAEKEGHTTESGALREDNP